MGVMEEGIVGAFTEGRIDKFASLWWANPVFDEKKQIISAGLKAFSAGSDDQAINCIKNLFSEVEGILRLHYHRDYGTPPTTADLKDYLKARAVQAFPHAASLAFPDLFFDYLNDFVFRSFDLQDGTVQISRHSVTHGVADRERYTRTHALQLILSLDQIYFYTKNSPGPPPSD